MNPSDGEARGGSTVATLPPQRFQPGPEQFVNFSFRSVHFLRMKLQFSSIPYSPTIEHGDCSVRLVEFDQKVHEFWPCFQPAMD